MTKQKKKKREMSLGEEIANAITHGVGTLLAIAALVILIVYASIYGDARHVVSLTIYGSTLVILYLTSTLYHSFPQPKVKYVFKILDHSAIYLLIAGTYTPFTLITLQGTTGWTIFGIVWGLAFIGILFKAFFVKRFQVVSTICYIVMGWIIIVAIKPLIENLPMNGVIWLVVGGLLYTLGAVFYLWERLRYNHAIWHLFVLGGSVAHFFSIFFYVLPLPRL